MKKLTAIIVWGLFSLSSLSLSSLPSASRPFSRRQGFYMNSPQTFTITAAPEDRCCIFSGAASERRGSWGRPPY